MMKTVSHKPCETIMICFFAINWLSLPSIWNSLIMATREQIESMKIDENIFELVEDTELE